MVCTTYTPPYVRQQAPKFQQQLTVLPSKTYQHVLPRGTDAYATHGMALPVFIVSGRNVRLCVSARMAYRRLKFVNLAPQEVQSGERELCFHSTTVFSYSFRLFLSLASGPCLVGWAWQTHQGHTNKRERVLYSSELKVALHETAYYDLQSSNKMREEVLAWLHIGLLH